MSTVSVPLSLRPISPIETGEVVRAVKLPTDKPLLIGRAADSDWFIPVAAISRRHASVTFKGGDWYLEDLASRHGTTINDRPLEPGTPALLQDGDTVAFGTWRCRCTSGLPRHDANTSFTPIADLTARVSVIPKQQLGGVAQRGLDVLMDLTGMLGTAETREEVARAAADAVRQATGCRRVVIVEPDSETELVVLASTAEDAPKVSRSLMQQAERQGLVELLVEGGRVDQAQSIMELGIRSAICAPIRVDDAATAFMMIDTRDAEGVVPRDAAAFCDSVARLTALAFRRISAASMAERHRQLQSDLEAARRAQELLSPPKQGAHAGLSYRFESIPGRVVAGDLFDVFPLDADRVAFFLGDVSGKGVGAAMLMAACQSQLRTQLLSGRDLAAAMAAVNTDLHARTEPSKFVTLVAAVVDVRRNKATIVDAGHGLLLRLKPGGVERMTPEPGFPLGVVDSADYQSLEIPMGAGEGLLVFSDGAVEQPDDEGHQLGFEGLIDALEGHSEPDRAVSTLIETVQNHAGGALADDLTVASVWLG